VLISSSLPSTAAWHTAPTNNPADVAHSSSNTNRSQDGSAPGAEPSSPQATAANAPNQPGASDTTEQNNASGTGTSRRPGRRASEKTADDAQSASGSAAATGASPTAPGTGDAEPGQFQTILGDVLPQSAQALNSDLLSLPDVPFGPGTAGAPHSLQAELTGMLDPAFEIGKQAIPADTRTAANQKAASGDVAFVARIAERTAPPAALTETAIAASRFDGAAVSGRSATGNTEPQSALTPKNDTPNPPAKAGSAQPPQVTPDDQPSFGANSNNRDNNAQSDADPSSGGPSSSHAAGDAQAAAATLPSQNAVAGMPAAASLSADPAGLRNSATVKAAQENAAPQLLEPRDQATGPSGESVRDISLRLSDGEQGSVQVRFSERAGELQVSVRTPDTDLSRGLRDGLSDLVGRLQSNGYRAETWQPSGSGDFTGQERGQDAPPQGGSSHGRSGGGSGSGAGQQNPHDQQQPDDQTPKWVREMESSIQRSNSIWPPSPTR
jgi:hypothetical protein